MLRKSGSTMGTRPSYAQQQEVIVVTWGAGGADIVEG
jgi:hypothetical protein